MELYSDHSIKMLGEVLSMQRVTELRNSVAKPARTFPWCLIGLLWSLFVGTPAESAMLRSSVINQALNNSPPSPFNSAPFLDFLTRTDNSILSLNESYTFSGQSAPAIPATMAYSVNSSVQSDYGILRTVQNTSINNVFFDPDNPDFESTTGLGVPDGFRTQSFSSFEDELTVIGDPELAEIRLVVRMTGELSQNSPEGTLQGGGGSISLFQGFSAILGSGVSTSPGGTIDQLVTTDPFPVVSGQAHIRLSLFAFVNWQIVDQFTFEQLIADGSSVSTSIDFSNTASVVDVEGFDDVGNPVSITSVTGQSGTVYRTTSANPVPEPSSILLSIIAGVIVLAFHQLNNCSTQHRSA